jgi:hypothetical protein
MGVRKAAEAATATAIRNGSGLTSSVSAMVIATGAATIAVAVLLSMSDSVIVTTISTVRIAQAGQPSVRSRPSAISAVPPEVSSAAPSGIIEPRSTTTGHSIRS